MHLSSETIPTAHETFFPPEHRARILDHMNEDHADAILNYARHFARREAATAARLTGIDRTGIDLAVSEPADESTVRIEFEKPLESPEDAHLVLVAMARRARGRGDPAAALERARAAVEKLRADLRTVILGTTSASGDPDASVAPVVLSAGGVLFTYVSDMSTHTNNLRETGVASVLVIEDESAASQLLARKRLTLRCKAVFVERDTPVFTEKIELLKAAFGPVMDYLAGLLDFHLVELTPTGGRLVAGFGQAYDVDAADWTKLTHVTGDGKGHSGHTAKA